MHPPDAVAPGEVGDGAGDAEDAVEAASREAHRFGGLREEAAAGLVGRRHGVEQFAVGLGVGADPMRGVAIGLNLARHPHPPAHFGRAFGRRRQDEVGGGDAGHLDMEVDAVEQRPRNLRLVIGGAARGAGAGQSGIAEMAAAAYSCCLAAAISGWTSIRAARPGRKIEEVDFTSSLSITILSVIVSMMDRKWQWQSRI
jgi:hypothetical protein